MSSFRNTSAVDGVLGDLPGGIEALHRVVNGAGVAAARDLQRIPSPGPVADADQVGAAVPHVLQAVVYELVEDVVRLVLRELR